jgi:hypothetical protein
MAARRIESGGAGVLLLAQGPIMMLNLAGDSSTSIVVPLYVVLCANCCNAFRRAVAAAALLYVACVHKVVRKDTVFCEGKIWCALDTRANKTGTVTYLVCQSWQNR